MSPWSLHGVVVIVLGSVLQINGAIPEYIHVCHRNDPKLAECIIKSIENLRPHLKVGMPEVDVPPLEPLLLDTVEIKSGNNATRIAAVLSDLNIWGPTSFVIEELTPNLDKNIFKFKVLVPKLYIEGKYKADAHVLFVNLKGEGPVYVNISNYRFDCKLKGNKINKDGEVYLMFDKMKLKIEVGQSQIKLDNLFNGDPVIGRATSDAISDNADLFINEIKPNLQNALSEKFTSIANKITLRFPYKELFP